MGRIDKRFINPEMATDAELASEATARQNADTNHQNQIDANTNKLLANDELLHVKGFRQVPESTTTSVSTKALSKLSNACQLFFGTATGQILRLPDATTISTGRMFDVWNFSSQTISVQDFAGKELAVLKANAHSNIILVENANSGGRWALTYTLDSGNTFGTSAQFVSDDAETSTMSQTVFDTKLTLVTPADMAKGDYMINFQFMWRASNGNKSMDVEIRQGTTVLTAWSPYLTSLSEKPLLAGFNRLTNISGQHTFTLNYKVGPNETTVYMSDARMYIWRIA